MRPRDDYGNYVAQRYFVPPHPAFVAIGTDRQMNLSSDRSDHPASWRSGGASTAELPALTAFAAYFLRDFGQTIWRAAQTAARRGSALPRE
jgi:hypothetical protein